MSDENIGERLKQFEGEQAIGEKLNELTEIYYKQFPRSFDDDWPQSKYKSDETLRTFLTVYTETMPGDIRRLARDQLGIELS